MREGRKWGKTTTRPTTRTRSITWGVLLICGGSHGRRCLVVGTVRGVFVAAGDGPPALLGNPDQMISFFSFTIISIAMSTFSASYTLRRIFFSSIITTSLPLPFPADFGSTVNSRTSSSATSLYVVRPFSCTFAHTFEEKCRKPFPAPASEPTGDVTGGTPPRRVVLLPALPPACPPAPAPPTFPTPAPRGVWGAESASAWSTCDPRRLRVVRGVRLGDGDGAPAPAPVWRGG